MHGAAMGIIAKTWANGSYLNKAHNMKYGVEENVKGTVNPALLTIK